MYFSTILTCTCWSCWTLNPPLVLLDFGDANHWSHAPIIREPPPSSRVYNAQIWMILYVALLRNCEWYTSVTKNKTTNRGKIWCIVLPFVYALFILPCKFWIRENQIKLLSHIFFCLDLCTTTLSLFCLFVCL